MADSKIIPLKKINIDDLGTTPRMSMITLRQTIRRGVKHAIRPWQIQADMPTASNNVIQGVYNVMVEEYTDKILEVFINEYLLP